MQLRDPYLDMTLRELLALHACARPRGESVDLEVVHRAVDAYAERLERTRASADADQREWLAEQIDSITIAPPAPTEGGRDA